MTTNSNDKSSSTSSSSISPFNVPIGASDSSTFSQNIFGDIVRYYNQIDDIKKEVDAIQEELDTTRDFYNSTNRLAKTTRRVVQFLAIIPLLQLVVCGIIVYILGIQEELPGILNWVLSAVSLASILEIILYIIHWNQLKIKVEELEKKVDKMEHRSQ